MSTTESAEEIARIHGRKALICAAIAILPNCGLIAALPVLETQGAAFQLAGLGAIGVIIATVFGALSFAARRQMALSVARMMEDLQ